MEKWHVIRVKLCFSSGFGVGFVYTNSIVVLGYYFNEKLGLATGIGLSGVTSGMFVIAPLIRYLNDEYSWRGAMLICGGMLGNICVFTSLYRLSQAEVISMVGIRPEVKDLPPTRRNKCVKDATVGEENEKKCKSIVKNIQRHSRAFVASYASVLSIRYVTICVASAILKGFSFFTALMYFVSNAIDLGIPKTDAAFLLSIYGICGTVGRLVVGPVIDKNIISPFHLIGSILLGIAGSSCLLGTLARSYVALVIFAVVFGFCTSSYNVLYPLLLRDVVGVNFFKKMFGISTILVNISSVIALPFMGKERFMLIATTFVNINLRKIVDFERHCFPSTGDCRGKRLANAFHRFKHEERIVVFNCFFRFGMRFRKDS